MLSVRSARLDDYPVFANLVPELGVDDPVPSPERFAAEVVPTTLIAENEGTVAGYAFFRLMKDVIHLIHLVTAPSARRRGVGRALMEETFRRGRAAGCTTMSLNVMPSNTAAITLYEGFGLRRVYTSRAMRIDWSVVDGLSPELTAHASAALPIAPEDDAALEREAAIPSGLLADHRAKPNRALRAIRTESGLAFAVFDIGFPGAYPFRATDMVHALSLLRALRPFARPEDASLKMMIEDQLPIAEGLIAHGAKLNVVVEHLRGALA